MTIVHDLELSRYGVRVNCISPGARSRLSGNLPGGLTSLTRGAPQTGGYDPWDPAHQAVVVAQLASADCSLNGQVLMVRGSTVTRGRTWSFDEQITKDGAGWDVEELGTALRGLPTEDPFDQLIPIGAAYGITGREQVRRLLHTILDGDDQAD